MTTLAELYNRLTPREEDVYHMLCLDVSMIEIAKQLDISRSTVGYHAGNIFRKFEVGTRYELIAKSLTPLWGEKDEPAKLNT